MFNPKSNNLLDEQLAVSGLEMGIVDPVTALAVGSAVTSIAGGIMGSKKASSQNKSNKKAAKKQKKFNKKVAKLTNKHNAKLDAAEQANHKAVEDFNHETALKDWQRGNEIQDYKYLQSLKQYEKNLTITNAQLDFNSQAEQQAIESEKTALQEAFIQQQFQRRSTFEDLQQTIALETLNQASEFQSLQQGRAELANNLRLGQAEQANILKIGKAEASNALAGIQSRKKFGRLSFDTAINDLMAKNNIAKETQMVEGLIRQGATQAAGQAGVSTAKTQQSNLAQMQRGLMGLEAELSGTAKKAALQLAELNSSLVEEEVGVGLNIERLESTTALNLERLESTTALDLKKLTDTTSLNLQRIDNTIKNAHQEARFNLDVMRENMKSTINQTQRNIEKIRLDRQVADTNTKAGQMLFPERLSYNPRPEKPPERIFVERMKAIPGYVPPPQQQSVWAPLVQGIGSAASSLATIEFGKFGNNNDNNP